MDARCNGCKYNTVKSKGGHGKICNGYTMTDYGRCPEWVINEHLETHKSLDMEEIIALNRVEAIEVVV